MKQLAANVILFLMPLPAGIAYSQHPPEAPRCEITSFSASIRNVEGAAANQEDMTVALLYRGIHPCIAVGFPKFDLLPLKKPEALTDNYPKRERIVVGPGDELDFNVHILGLPAENAHNRSCAKVTSFSIGPFQDLFPSVDEHFSLSNRKNAQIPLRSPNVVSICLLQVSRISRAAK